MTFTYSPIIRLFDIDNNTEANTWGDLTDRNLARLEQACHGVQEVSATTTDDYVLDDTSGTGTESHKKVLVVIGTQIQDINIIVPDRYRAYDVVNDAVPQGGDWKVTFKTAAQVTGFSIKSGGRARIYCNGTIVRRLISSDQYLNVNGDAPMADVLDMGGFKVSNSSAGTAGTDLVTKAQMDSAISGGVQMPIGSLYFNAGVSTNPATLLGYGTWAAFGQGRVIMGVGSGTDSRGETLAFSGGDTGGEYRHVQTIPEMVPHTHTNAPSQKEGQGGGSAWYNNSGNTGSTGGGQPANIMQPYIAVWIWRRTA